MEEGGTVLCEQCEKRPATVHLTKIINNQKSEAHLCEECARRKGEPGFFMEPSFGFHDLMANMFDAENAIPHAPDQTGTRPATRCENCGFSYADFRRAGQLGCSECYETFDRQLEPVLRKLHGSTRHTGKAPARLGGAARTRREAERLRRELQDAVAKEEYERAAGLRDRIRQIEKELG